MKLKNILFLLIATLLLVSCNGKKKKKTDDNNTKTEVIKNNNSGKANDVLLKKVSKIYNEQDTFSTVEIKFNLDFESPERSVSGSGTMRIANDSIIWLSCRSDILHHVLSTHQAFASMVSAVNQDLPLVFSNLKPSFL